MTTEQLMKAISRYKTAKAALREATSAPSTGTWRPDRSQKVSAAMEEYRVSRKALEFVIDRLEVPNGG
jgi:hypothetical protein